MEGASLQTFMCQYGISMQLMKENGGNPGRVHPETDIDRYRCRISMPGKKVHLSVAVPAEEGAITPSDVLFMLILDASGCEMFKDYYDRHHEFEEIFTGSDEKLNGFDEFWLEYESRCVQSRKLKAFLGNNLYQELISQFGFDN
jgi:hypothetical protein